MTKINLAITGCLGRMGQQLIKSSKSNKIFKLVSLTENKPINKKIGDIKSCTVVIDKYTKISKGFGFVEMTSYYDGEMAIRELHGTKIGKNKIRIKQSNDQ